MPIPYNLLKAVLDAPDEDQPRQAVAQWCVNSNIDSRAELIDKQLSLAVMGFSPNDDSFDLQVEVDELTQTYQQQWIEFDELSSLVDEYQYHRGFVEHVCLSAKDFLKHGESLFAKAPIRHLDLTDVAPVADLFFASPYLTNIVTLSLNRCQLTDTHIELLAKSPYLKNLRWLSIMLNKVDIDGAEALASSNTLDELEYVNFYGNIVDPTGYQAVDQGVIVEHILPEIGQKLEEQYGDIQWLHSDVTLEKELIPDRFMMVF